MLRRSILAAAPAGLLALSSARQAAAHHGQLTARRVGEWIDAYSAAWIAKDADAAAALFTQDAIYEAVPGVVEQTFIGRDAIRSYWANITAPQSNVKIRRGEPIVDDQRGVVELWVTMRLPPVNPLGDQMVTLIETNVLSFDRSGLCSRNVEYWNLQMGELAPPEGWGESC
jgi:uncharacterized protein (TIGR02246 family)